jgi:CRISPR system Cascade subunit CasB
MAAERSDVKETAVRLMGFLRTCKNDRGMLAKLRCALSEARRPRAWPLLARVGGIEDARIETVAGLFAYHPQETDRGNLGSTCARLRTENETFETRFLRLLACDRSEVCERVRPIVLAAKAKNIGVNYQLLFEDLSYWGDAVKTRWAKEYWNFEQARHEAGETTGGAQP